MLNTKGKSRPGIAAVSILLIVSLLVGCTQSNDASPPANESPTENFHETGYPIVDQPITLTMMGQSSPLQPDWSKMGFFQEMKKLTNIDFTFQTATSDQYTQKKQLAFSSLKLPDVFFAGMFTPGEEVDYGSQGLLIPLEDLIEQYAPNLQQVMEKYPDLKASITAPDGHIYTLPAVDDQPHSMTPMMWMNGYWLENVGAERPSTTDELYALLKQFKENDANQNGIDDEIPLSGSSLAELRIGLLPSFGISESDGIYEENGVVKYAFVQDQYKAYLEFMNQLYSEKLLDQEIVSHKWDQYVAKGAQNRVGVFPTWPIVMVGFTDVTEAAKYPLLPALTSPVNDKKLVTKVSEIKRGRFAITRENKYPEATMRWVDYLYSQEGSILARLGVENKNWRWTDSTKTAWELITPEGMNSTQANAQDAPGAGSAVPMVLNNEFFLKENNPTIHKIAGWVTDEYLPYAKIPYPLVHFTLEEQQEINVIKPDLDNYILQMEAKFITGETPLSEWDHFVKTQQSLKVDELVRIHQAAYDRFASVE